MAKYRKKPVEIDAIQWTGENQREMFDFLTNGEKKDESSSTAKQLIFHTAELMRQMGFTMNYGPVEVDRASTTEAYRWFARFRRTYCEGDSL